MNTRTGATRIERFFSLLYNYYMLNRTEKKKASVFQRLNKHELSDWLQDYSSGGLRRKNIVSNGSQDDEHQR